MIETDDNYEFVKIVTRLTRSHRRFKFEIGNLLSFDFAKYCKLLYLGLSVSKLTTKRQRNLRKEITINE